MKTTRVNSRKSTSRRAGGPAHEANLFEPSLRIPQDGPPVAPQLPDPVATQPDLPEELRRLPYEKQLEYANLFPLKFFSLDASTLR